MRGCRRGPRWAWIPRSGAKLTTHALWPHQDVGARVLIANRQWALFDKPGAGKTVTALAAIRRRGRGIVVCPSGVKFQWREFAREWRSDLRVAILSGSNAFRWPNEGEIVVLNYEILPAAWRELLNLRSRLVRMGGGGAKKTNDQRAAKLQEYLERGEDFRKRLIAPPEGVVLIADEAHRIKNDSARCTLRFRELAALVYQKGGSIWPMTGTPITASRNDLWVVLQAAGLGTKAWGTRDAFDEDWKVPGAIAAKLRTISLCRERPVDIATIRQALPVSLAAPAMRALDELSAAIRAQGVNIDTATLEDIRRAASAAQVAKCVATARSLLATAKIPALLDLVADAEAEGTPLVVFSMHRRPLDLLAGRQGWARISGDESAQEKFEVASQFQGGFYPRFIGGQRVGSTAALGVAVQTRAGGLGINVQRAWKALFVDLPWVPSDVDQAESRLRRPGQIGRASCRERV